MAGPAIAALKKGALSSISGMSPKATQPSYQPETPAMGMSGPSHNSTATLPNKYNMTPN